MTESQNDPLAPTPYEPAHELGSQIERRRCLTAHPQRFGIVPTWWFWGDPDNWALVRGPAAVLVGVITFAVGLSGLPLALAAILAPLSFLLAVGLLERYIRREAAR